MKNYIIYSDLVFDKELFIDLLKAKMRYLGFNLEVKNYQKNYQIYNKHYSEYVFSFNENKDLVFEFEFYLDSFLNSFFPRVDRFSSITFKKYNTIFTRFENEVEREAYKKLTEKRFEDERLREIKAEHLVDIIVNFTTKEVNNINKEKKKVTKEIELQRYDIDIWELFYLGVKSKNITLTIVNKIKREDIIKNPKRPVSQLRVDVDHLIEDMGKERKDMKKEINRGRTFVKCSEYNNTRQSKKSYILPSFTLNLYVDNSISFNQFFNYTKESTFFSNDRVKDIDRIKKFIEVLNEQANRLYEMESNLDKASALEVINWKQTWFLEFKKVLFEKI